MAFSRTFASRTSRFVRYATAKATAEWNGTLKEGSGTMSVKSDALKSAPFTFASRFEGDGSKTNPEELIGAAHAGCYSMFLSALLTNANTPPTSIKTSAVVTLGDGPAVTSIELECEAVVPGIDNAAFQATADEAKQNCPITKALSGVSDIKLNAVLK
eukprot:TRINITY_DN6305_c0_g1_i1.p1 TRINITY_DN6305_c0_g1~~TRINITY_DN6305_c0_g1_i1.p1  ORF type:complete len:158 (+),score=32.38 TRINITY_DN6305_c0_g1_i1:55-528(+)